MDIRVRNTMTSVRKALVDLMGEEKFENITISMLCENANISRKTFYMHYTSLDDVITDIGMDIYNQMCDRFKSKGEDYTMNDVLADIHEIILRNIDIYYKMATSESHHEFHIALEIAFQKIVAVPEHARRNDLSPLANSRLFQRFTELENVFGRNVSLSIATAYPARYLDIRKRHPGKCRFANTSER